MASLSLPSKPFTVYRSSAGSGKTYTLSREYLLLALKEPQYFRSILAVTFTNKATQEMKSRIVETLHSLAQGEDHPMTADLLSSSGFSRDELQRRATQTRSAILHNYSHFAVTTIDSFFQKIVRAFAKEVGLRAGFKVELDQAKVLDILIDDLLAQVGKDRHLTQWLTQFAEEQIDAGRSWDIRHSLKSLASEIFSEAYKQHESSLTQLARSEGALGKVLGQLKKRKDDFEQRMQQLGEQGLQAIAEAGLSITDFAYGYSGPANYFSNVLSSTQKYEPGKRVLEVLEKPEKWASKSSKLRDQLIQVGESQLNPRLQEILALYQKFYREYNSALEVLRNVYTLGILANLSRLLSDYREREDVMLISDAAVFLKDIIGQNETPFIYEKTGSHFRHFLIDEFQDTSGFQWDNFKPLVANSVAAGNKNLVVGDIKQSIYRWRGGNWKLLLEGILHDIGTANSELVPLNQNWRSCPLLIEFNNSVFYRAAQELRALSLDKISEHTDTLEEQALSFEAAHLSQAYADVSQQYPAVKPAEPCGLVEVQFLEDTEEDGHWKAQAQHHMLRAIERLQDEGYQPRDIAILVRSNGEGKELADVLMQAEHRQATDQYSYRVVSSDALYLDSAMSVNLLLLAIRVLHNPSDSISRVNLAYDYQRYILENSQVDYHHLFSQLAPNASYSELWAQYLPTRFIEQQAALSKLPLYELVETLISSFRLNQLGGEWAYLQAFQDAILQYSLDERGDVDTFLDWWAESGHKRTVQISESLNAIRIYTVHTSKGLQFKAVLIPYCQWELNHKPTATNFLWTQLSAKPFSELPTIPVKYASRLQNTLFAQSYYREMLQAYMDNLNLLYVAFTRAENCLMAWSPRPKTKGNSLANAEYVNGLLHRLFSGDSQASPTEIPTEYIELTDAWQEQDQRLQLGRLQSLNAPARQEETGQFQLSQYYSGSWRNRLMVRRRTAKLALAADSQSAARINWSRTIHTLLQRIQQPKDLDQALESIYYEGLVNKEEMPAVRQQMEQLFRHPLAGTWFNQEWRVKSELPLLSTQGFMVRPDRVLMNGQQAIAIDFKLESPRPAHQNRVRQYLKLLQRMNFTQLTGYLYYLEQDEVVIVTLNPTTQATLNF